MRWRRRVAKAVGLGAVGLVLGVVSTDLAWEVAEEVVEVLHTLNGWLRKAEAWVASW